MNDALYSLVNDSDISENCSQALKRIDQLLWNRTLLRNASTWDPYLRRMSGYGNAALDGALMPVDPLVEPDSSPMGDLANKGLMITAEAFLQTSTFMRTPLQVWARLHSMIEDDDEERGRPRHTDLVEDPLHIGDIVPHEFIEGRLSALVGVIQDLKLPTLFVAAIAHAELATVRPFVRGSYVIARATPRLVLASRELDQHGWTIPEFGMHLLGRASYVRALAAYRSGTLSGMREWIDWHNTALLRGAHTCEELTKTQPVPDN